MDINYVDGGVAAILLISAIMAYSRGFTREVLAIAGWLIAAAVAAFLTPMVEPLIRELPAVGSFLASSCVLSVITAFTLVMALGLLIMAVFTPVFSSMVLDSVFGPIDRMLGFVFGVARGALLIVIAFLLYEALVGNPQEFAPLAESQSFPYITDIAARLEAAMPTEMPPWLADRVDALMAPCAGEGLETGQGAEPQGFPEEPPAPN